MTYPKAAGRAREGKVQAAGRGARLSIKTQVEVRSDFSYEIVDDRRPGRVPLSLSGTEMSGIVCRKVHLNSQVGVP